MEAAIRAIAERHRREIVRLVRDRELTAGQIASHFEVSRPAVSQHLRILKDSGLVTERRQGTRRYYKARVEGLAELRAFLEVFLGEDTWIEPRSGAASPAETNNEIVLTDAATRPEQPVVR
ncbi:MAG: metalloregulator ArsR/SmtB family transcription factor [Actinomycetota bacterium]